MSSRRGGTHGGGFTLEGPLSVLLELGDETRLRVLASILHGSKNVSSIVSELGLSQPQVSYHLRRLKDAGLAVEEKDGRRVWYRANEESAEPNVRELLHYLKRWSAAGRETSPAAPKPEHEEGLDDFLL
ncbi:MAG: metalloregulator ArsR/SmtB family transcription factor [Candidatus Eisenbacteria bacterium]|nr:metalloregulator ArsR/SmtB family transcription factor [Candidatus Eisenbacteria bacterium]